MVYGFSGSMKNLWYTWENETLGVAVLAFQCARVLLEIHFVAAVPAEQKAGEQVNLLSFGRAVLCSDPLLRQVEGLLVDQRLMGVGEEVLLVLRIAPRLFGLVGYLVAFRRHRMPQVFLPRQDIVEGLIRPVVDAAGMRARMAATPSAACCRSISGTSCALLSYA